MKHLYSKCSRKLRKQHENHENTQLFVKSVPLSDFKLDNGNLQLNWNLPIVESELVNDLKSFQLVLTTKSFNSVDLPEITLKRQNVTIKTFKLPRTPQFVKINVNNAFKLTSNTQSQGVVLLFWHNLTLCSGIRNFLY